MLRRYSECLIRRTSNEPYDVVIVGAGIVGTACAAELAASGLRVVIVEPELIGGGATAAGMGHLAVMDDSPEQFALTRYSQLLWKTVAAALPSDVEYLGCGSLWIAADEFEMTEVRRKFSYYSKRGVPVEILDSKSLAEAEPNLRAGMAGALLMSDDAVLYSPIAARFFAKQAQDQGAKLWLGERVTRIKENTAELSNGTCLHAEWIVLANGTAATDLAPGINMQPRKGHLLITDRYPGFVNHQLIELGYLRSAHSVTTDSVAFNVQPRRTGQLLIGSSRQYGMRDTAVEPAILSRMLSRALEYMPALCGLQSIRTWTGFRAATPDKLPLIGPHPDLPGIYLATGHEGLGISTSLATARLIGDMFLDRPSDISREPYLPARVMLHV
jgi:glycine/D-amino acid oxidase-like deaminating enzyme